MNHFTLIFSLSSISMADINGDGKTDLSDVILSLRVITGLNTANSIRSDLIGSSGDLNADNVIGLKEVLYILKSVSELRP